MVSMVFLLPLRGFVFIEHAMEIDFESVTALERYQFLTHTVVPRPIAWVTTVNSEGKVNAAPFSFFNVFGSKPAVVALGIGTKRDDSPKDTVRNISDNGEFVINMVTEKLAEKMVQTSFEYAHSKSELEAVGLSAVPSISVVPPRIAESPVHLECRRLSIQEIGANRLILGTVVHGGVDDEFYDADSERILTDKIGPVGRMHGPASYTRTHDLFEIERP
jgi:flavin reductase (DIM6/NTAB) family NADH-FMN oxidoreductase RutF